MTNTLRAYTFSHPETIPISFSINAACAHAYDHDDILDVVRRYPRLLPQYQGEWTPANLKPAPWATAGQPYTDGWGCVWETDEDGISGVITHHPLADWQNLATFTAPAPDHHNGQGAIDWEKIAEHLEHATQHGQPRSCGLPHGFFFLYLTYIRGYEATIYDMMDNEVRLEQLIGMLEAFNAELIHRCLALEPEMVTFPEDLGAQDRPMVSPALFRRYLKPSYQRLMQPVREQGALVYMHSDGYILDLIDDLIEAGVQVINLQDLVNGLDNIAEQVKGRLAINLDIDRQRVTRFGSPRDIHDLIMESVAKLYSPGGGLGFQYGWYPGIPLANVVALLDVLDSIIDYPQTATIHP